MNTLQNLSFFGDDIVATKIERKADHSQMAIDKRPSINKTSIQWTPCKINFDIK